MDMEEDIHNYLLLTRYPRSFQKAPETVENEVEAPKKRSIAEDAFVTLLPLWSSRDFGDTEFRGSQGHLQVNPKVEVTEPGTFTVTGPTEEVGAEVRDEAVNAGAPGFGVDEYGYPDIEAGDR